MTAHSFTLFLNGSDLTEDLADRLYEAGCDDALVGMQDGRLYAAFTRSAASIEEAITSARADVENAGVEVIEVDSSEDAE